MGDDGLGRDPALKRATVRQEVNFNHEVAGMLPVEGDDGAAPWESPWMLRYGIVYTIAGYVGRLEEPCESC